jgi:FkbM family methyltransferase
MNQLMLSNYPIELFKVPSDGHGTINKQILPDINNNKTIRSEHSAKIDLFKTFQFSIVIENCREYGYFSEKIIDCLITKTIPIYYGCENISDYFNTDGWIILETDDIVTELKEKLQILNANYYHRYKNVIEENYKKAITYSSCVDNLYNSMSKIPYISIDKLKDNIPIKDMTFYSQYKQDEILYTKYFNRVKDGYFIEIGAHDGSYFSNTLFYEETLNWKGMCIEPHPTLFKKCLERRKCISLPYAITDSDGVQLFLQVPETRGDALSGILENYHPIHFNDIARNTDISNITSVVNTKSLQSILDNTNVKEIHYLSIDTEGSELKVLKGIDFEKVFIHLIEIENNYPDIFKESEQILLTNGFIKVMSIKCDEIFINSKSFLNT